jgi:hypothetical protein
MGGWSESITAFTPLGKIDGIVGKPLLETSMSASRSGSSR